MTDMVDNGSSGEVWPVSASESHNEFLELCALTTTDLLTSEERSRLNKHLPDCPECREALAQFQALANAGLPAAAAASADSRQAEKCSDGWSAEEAEAALFARLDHDEEREVPEEELAESSSRSAGLDDLPEMPAGQIDPLWQQIWWHYAAAAVLIAVLIFSVYRAGLRRGSDMALSGIPTSRPASRLALDTHPGSTTPPLQQATAATRDGAGEQQMRREMRRKETELGELESRAAKLDQNLEASETERLQLEQKVTDLGRQLAASQTALEGARGRLDVTASQNASGTVRMLALEKQVEELKTSLSERDQEIAREQELLSHDEDIRELMGSRDLYIAEVYDVAKNGHTQKPFGRVFYTKGKSLIFYAYDLDQQPGIRAADTFQAWGLRGPDQAVNLGILYVDNAAGKRWVLKADNPRTIKDIDAVFVTIEPHGGSQKPTGKRLLFAYLKVEPNHP